MVELCSEAVLLHKVNGVVKNLKSSARWLKRGQNWMLKQGNNRKHKAACGMGKAD